MKAVTILLFLGLLISGSLSMWNVFLAFNYKKKNTAYTKHPIRSFNRLYVIIPAMNEEATIAHLVNNLLNASKSNKYSWKINFIFVDDASEDNTWQELLKFKDNKNCTMLHRELPSAQTGKGDVLNFARDWINKHNQDNSNKIIVGVIDSDSYIEPKLFNDLYWSFAHSNYDLMQTGIAIYNKNTPLTIMQAFEFTACNLLTQVTRLNWGSAMASGNGQFMTLKMTNDVKWSDALLDDLEFSLRGLLKGYIGGFITSSLVSQQGITNYKALLKQRARWCQGGIQCFFKYFHAIVNCKTIALTLKLDIGAFLFLPFVGLLVLPLSLLSLIVYIINFTKSPVLLLTIVLVFVIINMLINLLVIYAAEHYATFGFNKMSLKDKVTILLGSLWYAWCIAPVPYISFYRNYKGRNSWTKTIHERRSHD